MSLCPTSNFIFSPCPNLQTIGHGRQHRDLCSRFGSLGISLLTGVCFGFLLSLYMQCTTWLHSPFFPVLSELIDFKLIFIINSHLFLLLFLFFFIYYFILFLFTLLSYLFIFCILFLLFLSFFIIIIIIFLFVCLFVFNISIFLFFSFFYLHFYYSLFFSFLVYLYLYDLFLFIFLNLFLWNFFLFFLSIFLSFFREVVGPALGGFLDDQYGFPTCSSVDGRSVPDHRPTLRHLHHSLAFHGSSGAAALRRVPPATESGHRQLAARSPPATPAPLPGQIRRHQRGECQPHRQSPILHELRHRTQPRRDWWDGIRECSHGKRRGYSRNRSLRVNLNLINFFFHISTLNEASFTSNSPAFFLAAFFH